MNPAGKDIANILQDLSSLGLTLATDLFYGRMPDGANLDNIVAVIDNPGDAPQLTLQKTTSGYKFSSVSIQVRNVDYDDGYEVINDIIDYLHGLSGVVESGTLYTLVKAMADPQVLEFDENDRVIFMVNFEVQRRIN